MAEDPFAFPFTEEEIRLALRLLLPAEDAAREARTAAAAFRSDSDWASSEETLLLLSLASEEAHAKVQRLRKAHQDARRGEWLAARPAGPDTERAWLRLVDEEERAWEARREALRRSLPAAGSSDPE